MPGVGVRMRAAATVGVGLMGVIHVPHVCHVPRPFGLPHGTLWRCEDDPGDSFHRPSSGCGRVWRLSAPGNPDHTRWWPLGWFGRWRHRERIRDGDHGGATA
jgi:hypothetical protein